MHMTFYWSTDIGEYFFDGLKINTAYSLAILCGILVILSIIYEAFKVNAANVRARAAREQIRAISCAPSETANLLLTEQNGPNVSFSKKFVKLFSEASVFFLNSSVGYALMLSVMAYSGWIFLSVVLGLGLGYFLFGHISMKINMENVQARTTTVICSPACPEGAPTVNGSKASSTENSPCRTISYQTNQPTTSVAACTTTTLPTISCCQETFTPTIPAAVDADCSCRL